MRFGKVLEDSRLTSRKRKWSHRKSAEPDFTFTAQLILKRPSLPADLFRLPTACCNGSAEREKVSSRRLCLGVAKEFGKPMTGRDNPLAAPRTHSCDGGRQADIDEAGFGSDRSPRLLRLAEALPCAHHRSHRDCPGAAQGPQHFGSLADEVNGLPGLVQQQHATSEIDIVPPKRENLIQPCTSKDEEPDCSDDPWHGTSCHFVVKDGTSSVRQRGTARVDLLEYFST